MLRRVITARDSKGDAVFVDDSQSAPKTAAALPGVKMHYIWGADQRNLPRDGTEPQWRSHFPPAEGVRFVLLELAAGQAAAPIDSPSESQLQELEETFPGLLGTVEPGTEGMHASETIDFAVVLSGPITLELSDNDSTVLQTGDVVVQSGNVHRWVNRGHEPALVAGVVLGANYDSDAPSH
jgi:quercetin dioxygenase-like cupin family protein